MAWTREALIAPHDDTAKADRVNAMFDAIADSYDLNNRLHSLWRDQAWRRAAVNMARVRPQLDDVVDVACGTGDLAMAFADRNPRSVIGVDFTPSMIDIARTKAAARSDSSSEWPPPDYHVGDAMALQLPDASADIVSIAFGIRNVIHPAKAVSEFRRILRPGGRLVILEFSMPRNPIMRGLYSFYFHQILPRTATLISRDRTGAYKYLPRSVSTFITADEMQRLMMDAGFVDITMRRLTLGICHIYLGHVPADG